MLKPTGEKLPIFGLSNDTILWLIQSGRTVPLRGGGDNWKTRSYVRRCSEHDRHAKHMTVSSMQKSFGFCADLAEGNHVNKYQSARHFAQASAHKFCPFYRPALTNTRLISRIQCFSYISPDHTWTEIIKLIIPVVACIWKKMLASQNDTFKYVSPLFQEWRYVTGTMMTNKNFKWPTTKASKCIFLFRTLTVTVQVWQWFVLYNQWTLGCSDK